MATLLSVNVGLPKNVSWQSRTVYTGVWKRSVPGPRRVRRLNLDGDGQGDLQGHGGEQRAVLVYQIESYHYWADHFGRNDFEFGEFGENFTVTGLGDDDVCVGDRLRIGDAEFEVTQPRVTCYRVAMRLGEPELPALLVSHHRPGFYLRVITEGTVEAGQEITLTRSGPHSLSVADIDALLYLPDRDPARLRDALDIPALSPGWQESFRDLLHDAAHAGPQDQPGSGGNSDPGWPGFRRMRVAAMVTESPAVTSLYLTPESGAPLPRPRPGQYLTVRTVGAGDPPSVRSYSISSAPDAKTYRISVKREPQGLMSGYLHTLVRPGSILEVAAPRGDFVLSDDDEPIVLMSAGIGVTPVLAMLHRLSAAQSAREVWWIHTAHDAAEDPFSGEVAGLLHTLRNPHTVVFYTADSRGGPESALGTTVMRGRPTLAALGNLGIPVDASAYLCGPAAFMSAMRDALISIGLAADRLHTELFAPLPAVNPGVVQAPRPAPHQPTETAGAGPQITFARSGLTVRWSAAAGSLLDLADACDVPTRWSCRTGVCHTCVTALVSGEITYRPAPLELPERGQVLICCARPNDDLVLDL